MEKIFLFQFKNPYDDNWYMWHARVGHKTFIDMKRLPDFAASKKIIGWKSYRIKLFEKTACYQRLIRSNDYFGQC